MNRDDFELAVLSRAIELRPQMCNQDKFRLAQFSMHAELTESMLDNPAVITDMANAMLNWLDGKQTRIKSHRSEQLHYRDAQAFEGVMNGLSTTDSIQDLDGEIIDTYTGHQAAASEISTQSESKAMTIGEIIAKLEDVQLHAADPTFHVTELSMFGKKTSISLWMRKIKHVAKLSNQESIIGYINRIQETLKNRERGHYELKPGTALELLRERIDVDQLRLSASELSTIYGIKVDRKQLQRVRLEKGIIIH